MNLTLTPRRKVLAGDWNLRTSLFHKNVIDVLGGEAEPETDGREGLKTLEVLIATYLSARDNKTVSLPLEY